MKAKPTRKRGLDPRTENDRHIARVRRLLGKDVEIIDAKRELRVFIRPEDLAKAVIRDPGECVFAQACKRQFGAGTVFFWRSRAFVELPGEDGVRRVERFVLPKEMRKLIEDFDSGRTIIPEAGFLLNAPTESQTLEHERIRRRPRRRLEREREEAKKRLLGTTTPRVSEAGKPTRLRDRLIIRSGAGQVHFNCVPV
jgi:hypothetical protein